MCNIRSIIKYIIIFSVIVSLPGPVSAFVLNDSASVTITATVGSSSISPSIPSSGGGGEDYTFKTTVNFSGFAYRRAIIHVWKNGIPKTTTTADKNGFFTVDLDEPYSDKALYTLYAIDAKSRRSVLLNYPVAITDGYYTKVKGIRFAPTVSINKTEVHQGDSISISGYATPDTNLSISINGKQNTTLTALTSSDGTYQLTYPLTDFPKGDYATRANYEDDNRTSKVSTFTIGDANVSSAESVNNIPGDCNGDQIINIVDFSVLAFWYGKSNPPACVDTNHDDSINLVDFSILAYYWTG